MPAPADPSGWNQDFITHYGRAGWDYVFTPSLVNEVNIGYNRTNSQNYNSSALEARSRRLNWATQLGIGNVTGQNFPIVTFGEGFPNLSSGHNDDNVDNGERFYDQLSWTKGKHSLAFGVDLRNQLYSTFGYDNDGGTYNFARAETAATQNFSALSGNGFASFLLGDPRYGNAGVHATRGTLGISILRGLCEGRLENSTQLNVEFGFALGSGSYRAASRTTIRRISAPQRRIRPRATTRELWCSVRTLQLQCAVG